MDQTDDGKKDTGQDAAAKPPSPPNMKLIGWNMHGQKIYPDSYYYTEEEWSRIGMQGPLPEDRKRPRKELSEYGEETGSTDGIFLQEVMDHK